MRLTAQSYGSEKQTKPTYLLMSIYLGFVFTLLLSILVIILANPLTQLITDKSSVISLATHILPLAIGFNLINGLQIIIRSALQSMDMEKWVFPILYMYLHRVAYLDILLNEMVPIGRGVCGSRHRVYAVARWI
jgi:Na+-driven multidrug efflux pump